MESFPASVYARALKSALPTDIHAPATSRLWWLPVHLLVIATGITLLAAGWVPLALWWAVSLLIGLGFAGTTFLAHETLHGAVVRGRHWQRLIGGLGFLPFCVSPRLWVAWHNRVHHGHTQEVGTDPDAFPTLDEYRNNGKVRFMIDWVGASRGAPAGFLALVIGFTLQSSQVLLSASRLGVLPRKQQRLAMLESALGWTFWLTLGWFIGWLPFLFAFVLPLLVANTVVMAFILTNHTLSPLTKVNDPLLNSLSVTLPRWAEWLTQGFGYHVEHHLYPWMSMRHAKAVRALIVARWPERYQAMPLWRALRNIYSTPRVYKDATTLVDPHTGREWHALVPGSVSLSSAPAAQPPAANVRPSAAPASAPDGIIGVPAAPLSIR